MRTQTVFASALIAAGLLAGSMKADVIVGINSNANVADESNNKTGADVVITPHPLWAPAGVDYKWVSFQDSGEPGTQPVTDNVPGSVLDSSNATAIFSKTFMLPYAFNNSGFIKVWADDTAGVYLDGKLLKAANPNQGPNCANAPIGCIGGADANLWVSGLSQGNHTLQIDAYQRAGGPFGVMYTGAITSSPTPEPGTCALLASGLAGLMTFVRRRKKNS